MKSHQLLLVTYLSFNPCPRCVSHGSSIVVDWRRTQVSPPNSKQLPTSHVIRGWACALQEYSTLETQYLVYLSRVHPARTERSASGIHEGGNPIRLGYSLPGEMEREDWCRGIR